MILPGTVTEVRFIGVARLVRVLASPENGPALDLQVRTSGDLCSGGRGENRAFAGPRPGLRVRDRAKMPWRETGGTATERLSIVDIRKSRGLRTPGIRCRDGASLP